MRRVLAVACDLRTVSFLVLAIGSGALAVLECWVGVGMLVFSWSVVQIVQLAIDEDTRIGEIFGTIGLLSVCAGLYHFPMIAAFVLIAVFTTWVWLDH